MVLLLFQGLSMSRIKISGKLVKIAFAFGGIFLLDRFLSKKDLGLRDLFWEKVVLRKDFRDIDEDLTRLTGMWLDEGDFLLEMNLDPQLGYRISGMDRYLHRRYFDRRDYFPRYSYVPEAVRAKYENKVDMLEKLYNSIDLFRFQ